MLPILVLHIQSIWSDAACFFTWSFMNFDAGRTSAGEVDITVQSKHYSRGIITTWEQVAKHYTTNMEFIGLDDHSAKNSYSKFKMQIGLICVSFFVYCMETWETSQTGVDMHEWQPAIDVANCTHWTSLIMKKVVMG